ncbi:sigma-70 family RNA polymerase sigma factor [Deltaproteobacteria bacterium]|nr:sigma-70 family RNA polymerase sigma factor [Deltaproteobacteria bacterium]
MTEGGEAMRGWWSGHKVVDPVELERRYANEDSMSFMDMVFHEEISEEGKEMLVRVESTLDLLPPTEADFIELYYFKHLKQTDIAEIFGVSQPTVCYRLQRAARRIQFLLSLPVLEEDEMERVMSGFLDDPTDARIMVLMYQTTCQSEVAKQLGVSQGFVRHRFIRSISRMEKSIVRKREIEESASLAIDVLTEWGALDALGMPELDEVVAAMGRMGVLDPTGDEIVAASNVLLEKHRKTVEDAARLGQMFGGDGEVDAAPPVLRDEEVLGLARQLREQKARRAVKAIEAREEQDAQNAPALAKFVSIFQAISGNLNILREVQRPAWGNRVMLMVH